MPQKVAYNLFIIFTSFFYTISDQEVDDSTIEWYAFCGYNKVSMEYWRLSHTKDNVSFYSQKLSSFKNDKLVPLQYNLRL